VASRLAARGVVALVLGVLAAGCNDDGVRPESPAPGEAARVVRTSVGIAGGREIRQETRIDSATGRYTLRECSSTPIGVNCLALVVVREGTVAAPLLRELFVAAARREFRALRAEYRGPTDIVRPDGGSVQLEIVRDGTRRLITWAFDATIPPALLDYDCLLRAARADPFLCD